MSLELLVLDKPQTVRYQNKQGTAEVAHTAVPTKPRPGGKTGSTYEAPKVILSVVLLVYYVGRLVTLFIGAVLSPLVILIWLVPGWRDFSESAAKTYLSTVFVLFVHVVILQLAASLFVGLSGSPDSPAPDTLMSMIVGLATILALLRTQ